VVSIKTLTCLSTAGTAPITPLPRALYPNSMTVAGRRTACYSHSARLVTWDEGEWTGMRRIAMLAAALLTAATAVSALAAPASAGVRPPQPDPVVIVDR
jgi:hypothetical protein